MATHVYYVVPEDLDDFAHPNLLVVSAAAPTLRDVKNAFVLPGQYHFRFKRAFKSGFVWVDILDDAAAVPMFDGYVFAKVSRVTSNAANAPAAAAAAKPAPPQVKAASSAPAVVAAWGEDDDVWNDSHASAPAAPPATAAPPVAPAAPAAAAAAAASEDLFGFGFSGASAAAPAAKSAPAAIDLLGTEPSTAAPDLDFWSDAGFASATPPQQPSPPPRPASAGNAAAAAAAAAKPKSSVPATLGSQAAKQFTL